MINRALRLGVVFGARVVDGVDGVGEVVGARKEPDVSPDVGESPRDRYFARIFVARKKAWLRG